MINPYKVREIIKEVLMLVDMKNTSTSRADNKRD